MDGVGIILPIHCQPRQAPTTTPDRHKRGKDGAQRDRRIKHDSQVVTVRTRAKKIARAGHHSSMVRRRDSCPTLARDGHSAPGNRSSRLNEPKMANGIESMNRMLYIIPVTRSPLPS